MKIQEVLKALNIPYVEVGQHHHARSGWINIDCPHCGTRGAYHLGINLEYGYTNCWRCGKHKLPKVLHAASNSNWGVIKGLLKDVEYEVLETEIKPRGDLVIPKPLPGTLLPIHRKYLRGRGLIPEKLESLWEIKSFGTHPRLGWRIFIPIIYHGETVSWTTRTIGNGSLRYISANPEQERISHKEILFGEDYCRHTIIVCEGPFDVFTIGPGAVATLGTGFSAAQVRRISKYPIRVVLFNSGPGESQAQRRARQLCDQLEGFDGATFNVTLSGNDANSSPKREIRELRRRFLE